MSTETKQEAEAFERYNKIVDLLREFGDNRGLGLVRELVDKCVRYIDVTSIVEAHSKMLRSGRFTGGEDRLNLQRASESLDMSRRTAHNALISQLIIVNRYAAHKEKIQNEILPGGIYSLDPRHLNDPYSYDSRVKIGDWAKYLTDALYRRGIIRKE